MEDPRWKFSVWEVGGGARSQAGRVIVPFIISILPYGLIGFGILGICFYYNILRDGGVIKIKDKDRE